MARLTAPDGTVVTVSDDKAATLARHGYQPEAEPAKAASAKKSADPTTK